MRSVTIHGWHIVVIGKKISRRMCARLRGSVASCEKVDEHNNGVSEILVDVCLFTS